MNFPKLSAYDVIALDVETTGINWNTEEVFGVAISIPGGGDFYYDTRVDKNVFEWMKKEIPKCKLIVNHNIKFDMHMLLNHGVVINPKQVHCTMIRAALIDEHLLQYNLDSLTKKYLNIGKVDDIYQKLADLFGGRATRHNQMQNLFRAPKSIVGPYATRDSRLALELYWWQEKEIEKQGLRQILGLEMKIFPHIFAMERHGIRIDLDRAEKTTISLTKEIKLIQKELNQIAGFPVNPNPSGSIHKLFNPTQNKNGEWEAIDGTILPRTPAGKASIGSEQLRLIQHPAAGIILRCRKLMKTRDTFIKNHILGHEHNGRVYPTINQTKSNNGSSDEGTGTGRLSYTRPALQQIPSRDRDIAAIMRPIFLPDEGQCWYYGDLDQHEFRVFAHYVNTPKLNNAYKENPDLDIHSEVADLTGLPRNPSISGGANAKQMNLAMVFNMGGGALAEKMKLPFTMESFIDKNGRSHEYKKPGEKATEILEKYYKTVPGVKNIANNAASVAKSRGYVKTLMGRHIRFPGGNFVYKASGLIYQGTAADLNKDCIHRVCSYLENENFGGSLLLNIHDEFNLSLPEMPLKESVKHLSALKDLIQNRPELRIPIRIDFGGPGEHWWDATNKKKITPKSA